VKTRPDSDTYDVAVVGASIAGCTAAIFLARAGAKVALIDNHSSPDAFKRICTHFMQPSASPTIERLGLRSALQRLGAQPSGLNIWTRYGWVSSPFQRAQPQHRHPGWNIRREVFDPLIRKRACDTNGVELMLGCKAVAVLRSESSGPGGPGRVSGLTLQARDGSEQQIRAKLVVGADGRGSSIARFTATPEKRKPHGRFGYFAYYRDTPLVTGSSNQMWLLDPDVAYAFPTDSGLTLLVCTPHKQRLAEFKRDPEEAMRRVFERLPDGPRLDPEKRMSPILGKIETPIVVRRAAQPGVALIGDAAFESDPVWGVGCGWALQSAEWLADAVAPALSGSESAIDSAVEVYAKRHRRELRPHEITTSQFATGRKFTVGERLVWRAAARDPELAARAAAVGGRWVKPHQILTPGTLARIVRANMSPSRRTTGLSPVMREGAAGAPPAVSQT
jgi:menaquinone-9 beta-reductase